MLLPQAQSYLLTVLSPFGQLSRTNHPEVVLDLPDPQPHPPWLGLVTFITGGVSTCSLKI